MSAPGLIDTHCHLNFHSYDTDRAEVLQRARNAGIARIIIPAIDLPTCLQALDLAAKHRGLYVAVGIHPNSCKGFESSWLNELRKHAGRRVLVAIGEIGLDYHWDKCPKSTQQRALEAQLELATELELPVILHNRNAADDLLSILSAWAPTVPASLRNRLGVLHSFSASYECAQRAIELGFYLGFTGPITYKQASELRAIAAIVPEDRVLVETDGPFLAPQQRRGKRNEPAFLVYINEKLAVLRKVTPDAMAQQTTANAERLFRIG